MSKIPPIFYALGIPVVVIVILLAVVLPRLAGGQFSDLSAFSVDGYRKDWATMQGNVYRLDCQIEQQLSFVEGKGRILAVKPTDITRGAGRISVFIPLNGGNNFEVGQRYKFKVRVSRDLLVVEELEKF
ncbi:MAG: hypothetical protein JHC77_03995 [Opitutales bacterium]|jgi:hypothetical protein|nr:hypothetical protein [Opitutales bacterium]